MRRNLDRRALISALVLGLGAVGLTTAGLSPVVAATTADDAAYTRTITERADKIVAPLKIDDAAKAERVRDLIVNEYRGLSEIQSARDAKIAQAPTSPNDASVADAWRGLARKEADLKIFPLHRQFVAHLESELTAEQVNQVKDGLTYGVVPITFKRYRQMLPNLKPEQQAFIMAALLEAREYAMDGGTSEEKHAWFGKYKGRINNYLSAAGIDMKQAEKDLADREKAAAQSH